MPPGLRRLQSANEGSDELLSCLVRVSRESKTLSSFPWMLLTHSGLWVLSVRGLRVVDETCCAGSTAIGDDGVLTAAPIDVGR